MNIVFFTHPGFSAPLSMVRFTRLLVEGMQSKGHTVACWFPKGRFVDLPFPKLSTKWLGYIDQYVIFPFEIRKKLSQCGPDTLFVFIDNALGPWMPVVANRPHVMHCHDFLALQSALGEIEENPTSWTGKQYQNYIRRGYRAGKHFISDSYKTQKDLHHFMGCIPDTSEMRHIGLNPIFSPKNSDEARLSISKVVEADTTQGYLLHVGGNAWYKNRTGVIDLYNALCSNHQCQLPLIMIGAKPGPQLIDKQQASAYSDKIFFLSGMTDQQICSAYSGASLFLFPSLAEGFGWPIAEAMASGCPVVTTNEEPMTEVAGGAAILIGRRPANENLVLNWATESATVINESLQLSPSQRATLVEKGLQNASRFVIKSYIDEIERIYKSVLTGYK